MLKTTIGQITDKGLKRQANEDNLLALPERGLFLVADGVGGRRGGQIASRTVTEVFERVFNQSQPTSLPESEMEDLRKLVGSTVDLCNQKIFTEAELNAELDGMATTLALAAVKGNRAIIAHVGDSRVYRCDPQGLIQLTEDHSEVNEAVKAGILTPEQAENHPRRNVISRAIGADSEVEAEIIEIEIDRSTMLFLCSDGITRHIRDEQLEKLLRSGDHPQAVCQTMKEICYTAGAEDNLTAIIVQFSAQTEADEQTKPMRSSARAGASAIGSAGAAGNIGESVREIERPKRFAEIDLSSTPSDSAAPDFPDPPDPVNFPQDDFDLPESPQQTSGVSVSLKADTPPVGPATAKIERESRKQAASSTAPAQQIEPKEEMSKLMSRSILIVTLLAGFVLGGLFGGPLSRVLNNGAPGPETDQPRVLRYSPSDPNVADAYGLMIATRNDEARRRLNEILLTYPNNAEARYCMGRLDYVEKRYEEAVNQFKKAVELNPELDEAWVFIAAAYLNIGQARNASDSLQKLITPSPSPSPSPSASTTPASTAKPVG
jgi:PPM family protein phosphatase